MGVLLCDVLGCSLQRFMIYTQDCPQHAVLQLNQVSEKCLNTVTAACEMEKSLVSHACSSYLQLGPYNQEIAGETTLRMPPWPLMNCCVTMGITTSPPGLSFHEYKNEARGKWFLSQICFLHLQPQQQLEQLHF